MLLINRTPLPAAIVPNAGDDDSIVALLVVAATFDIAPDRLRFSDEQRPLRLEPEVPLIGDGYLTKAGTSVNAEGFVYAAGGSSVRADATLLVGEEQRTVAAIGPRTWRELPAGGGLVPTHPQPFDRVAMTWENAYGGAVLHPTRVHKLAGEEAILPEHPEAFAENMDGKGFYTELGGAIDAPLPELEDPARFIEKWDDRPDPVCFAPYPMHGGLRARFLMEKDVVDFTRHPHVLSRAAPFTTFGEIPFGTRVALTGMRPGGAALAFHVPPPPVTADILVGPRHRRLELYVDAIDIDAEAAQVRVAYRALFSYPLVRYEQRTAHVRPSPDFEKLLTST